MLSGEVTSKPRLEEEKIAWPWKRGECISDIWVRGGTCRDPEGERVSQAAWGWNSEDVQRGVRSGARLLGW